VRMGPVAFSAERDRLLRGRGRGSYGTNRPGGNGNGSSVSTDRPEVTALPVGEPVPAAAPVAVGAGSVAAPSVQSADAPIRVSPMKPRPISAEPELEIPMPTEPSDEPTAPPDAVPIQAAPAGAAASVEVVFEPDVPVERLLPAIESVTQFLRGRPGPIAVVLQVPVAGATRQIRLPDRVAWDDRIVEGVRRAAELPVAVELRAPQGEP
jgi:hypothetical protein